MTTLTCSCPPTDWYVLNADCPVHGDPDTVEGGLEWQSDVDVLANGTSHIYGCVRTRQSCDTTCDCPCHNGEQRGA